MLFKFFIYNVKSYWSPYENLLALALWKRRRPSYFRAERSNESSPLWFSRKTYSLNLLKSPNIEDYCSVLTMRNESEVVLFDGCTCMLQAHQIVSSTGQLYSWFAVNTVFTIISVALTCFVMYSIFRTEQFTRSPIMAIFIYAWMIFFLPWWDS